MFQTVAQRSEDHVFHVWKGRCGPRDSTIVCFLKPDSSVYLRIRLLQPRFVDVTVSIKTFLSILEPIRSGLRGANLDDTDGDQIYCVLRESAHQDILILHSQYIKLFQKPWSPGSISLLPCMTHHRVANLSSN